jgi:uncharacterized pyridoxamine 5'-phosphate oxidase family protein
MPFKPGQCGNRKGRPKGTTKARSIAEACLEFLAEQELGKPRLRVALQRLYTEDLKTFFAYAYGKPIETQIHQNPDGSNLSSQPTAAELAGAMIIAKKREEEIASKKAA